TLMLALLAAQLFTGLTTIFFQWPLLIAVLHNGGAAGLTLAAVVILVRLADAPQAAGVIRPQFDRV
ncbi:COX15/CtaA family protein, partial [Bordetella pertussis]